MCDERKCALLIVTGRGADSGLHCRDGREYVIQLLGLWLGSERRSGDRRSCWCAGYGVLHSDQSGLRRRRGKVVGVWCVHSGGDGGVAHAALHRLRPGDVLRQDRRQPNDSLVVALEVRSQEWGLLLVYNCVEGGQHIVTECGVVCKYICVFVYFIIGFLMVMCILILQDVEVRNISSYICLERGVER